MQKAKYSIRLTLIPSRIDPYRSKVRATLRLSDGRRFYFTSKSSVDTIIASHLFTSFGVPYNPENYDKHTYSVMSGLYTSIQEAMFNLLYVECYEVEELTREQIKSEIKSEVAGWNRNHAGEGVEYDEK